MTHDDVSHKSSNLGIFGWIIISLLAVVALMTSVGMFTVGILSVLGIPLMPS